MATLALGLVGTAIGAGIGGGITVLGATLTAASIGGAIGSFVGGIVDNMIIAALTPAIRNEGPRLQEITVMQSSEGAAVGRLYGIIRVGCNLIWAVLFYPSAAADDLIWFSFVVPLVFDPSTLIVCGLYLLEAPSPKQVSTHTQNANETANRGSR